MELPQSSSATEREVSGGISGSRLSTPPKSSAVAAFLAENQQTWATLQVFLDVAEGWTLGLVEVNFADEAQLLVAALQEAAAGRWQVVAAVLDDPELRYLRDALLEQLAEVEPPPEGLKRVVVVAGLERAIGMTGDYPPLLQDLNLLRDAYVPSVPHPMLILLPDYALTRLARFAPDFWAWRSYTFRFKSMAATRALAFAELESRDHYCFEDIHHLKSRIDLLERLLQESCPTGAELEPATRKLQIQLLNELGNLYQNQGDLLNSQYLLRKGLDLVDDRNLRQRVGLLGSLGHLQMKQRDFDDALLTYEQAIDLANKLGDELARVGLISDCGSILLEMREFTAAKGHYNDALQLSKGLKSRSSQARIHHNLGIIAQKLHDFEDARRNYNQALKLLAENDDRHSQARTYHQLGWLAQDLQAFEEAQHYYEIALKLWIDFGDRCNQARTYHQLGWLAQNLQAFGDAKQYYELALEIWNEFGEYHHQARTYHQLGGLAQIQQKFSEARHYYGLALEVFSEFDDRHGQASTYGQLGLLAETQGDHTEAANYLLLSLRSFVQFSDQQNIQKVLQFLARIYQQTQDKTLLTAGAEILNTSPDELRAVFGKSAG